MYFQHDRAEIQVIATGRGQRRWVVDYSVIDLDPTILDTYPALDEYLRGTWKTTRGIEMPTTAVALDGGNWTETVAQLLKQLVNQSGQARIVETPNGYIKQTVYLIRGRNERKSERGVYRPAKTEVNNRGKTVARSVGVWGVGTSVLKTIVYGWLSAALTAKNKAEAEGQAEDLTAQMLRFPGGRGDEVPDPINTDPGALPPAYYKGLTVEFYDKESGYWIKPKGARNEPLDTVVYAIWTSLSPAVKADVIRDSQWQSLEKQYQPSDPGLFSIKQKPLRRRPSQEWMDWIPVEQRGLYLAFDAACAIRECADEGGQKTSRRAAHLGISVGIPISADSNDTYANARRGSLRPSEMALTSCASSSSTSSLRKCLIKELTPNETWH